MTEPAPNVVSRDQGVLHFRDGIPGFPEHQHFALVDLVEDGAFQLLQSAQDPDMSMVVTVPWLFFPDYAPEIDADDERDLGLASAADAVVFCPVTFDAENDCVSLNLAGPFIVNSQTLEGRQVVLKGDYPMRATITLG